MGMALWRAYAWLTCCAASEVERTNVNVRTGVGIIAITLLEFVHALPVLGGGMSRLLVGAVFFTAYAGWRSVPALHGAYADLVAPSLVARGDVYAVVAVTSDGMLPDIHRGAFAVVDYSAYLRRDPQIGDVVAVALTPQQVYLKRLVAMPGDSFAIGERGVLTDGRRPDGWHNDWFPGYQMSVDDDTIEVDGVPLDRSVANVPDPAAWPNPSRLPDDCYFVLGDNINDSEDSHVFGCVPRRAIVGEVAGVL